MTDSRCLQYRAALPQEMQGHLQRDLYTGLSWKIDSDYLQWAKDAWFPHEAIRLVRLQMSYYIKMLLRVFCVLTTA